MGDEGSILGYIRENLRKGSVHMTLIDPDKQEPEEAAAIAGMVEGLGSDAIMVGGSTGVSKGSMDATVGATVGAIKEACRIPAIIFPTAAGALSPRADAVYFMSMLNSRARRYIVGEQRMGAPIINEMGVEPISMGYIIVEPGMEVGRVGDAELVPREEPELAASYALCAQMFGMSLVYLEAGSGAPEPVPPAMVSRVKEVIRIPLVVGGGIRSPEAAAAAVGSGADIVVTGTVVEDATQTDRLGEAMGPIIRAVKGKNP
jgi:phosphoglycerol geranylgeranyltransferase